MAEKSGNIKKLMDVMLYVLFASFIIPVIAVNIRGMTGDTENFSGTELLVLGLITTFIIIGVVYGIYKEMF